MRSSSRLVTGVCHSADRVSDSEIGGVRKVKRGIGDVSPTTAVIGLPEPSSVMPIADTM